MLDRFFASSPTCPAIVLCDGGTPSLFSKPFIGAVAKPESFATDFFYLFQLNAIKITKKNPIYVLNIGYFSNGMFEK